MTKKTVDSPAPEVGAPDSALMHSQLDAMLAGLLGEIPALSSQQRKALAKPRVTHGGIFQVVAQQAPKYGVELAGATVAEMLAAQKSSELFGAIAATAAQVARIAADGHMAHGANAWTIATTIYGTLGTLSKRHPELNTALEPVRAAMRVGKVGSKGRKGTAAKEAEQAETERERAAAEAAKAAMHVAPANGANGVSAGANGVAAAAAH